MFMLSNRSFGRNFAAGERDKIMIGVIVVALLAAGGIMAFYLGGGEDNPMGGDGTSKLECVDPACGNTWQMTDEEINEAIRNMPQEMRAQMAGGVRMECPKCHNPKLTGVRGFPCPRCGKSIVSARKKAQIANQLGFRMRIPPDGPIACPHCGLEDVEAYWNANKGKKAAR